MKIYNGTPHEINLVEGSVFDASIRKWVGGRVILSIPSEGMLNAHMVDAQTGALDHEGVAIPVFEQQVNGCDPLPEGYDAYIVSAMYASAHGQTADGKIYVVHNPVMSEDGKTFRGCQGLKRW